MVHRQSPIFRGKGGAALIGELFRMEFDAKSVPLGSLENPFGLIRSESDGVTESVHSLSQALSRHFWNKIVAQERDVVISPALKFAGQGMSPQKGRAHRDRESLSQTPGHAKHSKFRISLQTVAGLDLQSGNPLVEQG